MFDAPLGLPVDAPSPRVTAGLGVIPRIVRDGAEIYRGKLGARFGTTHDLVAGKLTFYGGANAVKAFQGRDTLVFTNNGLAPALRDNRIDVYGEGFAGLSVETRGGISGFIEAFGDYGARDTQRGGGGRAGLRLGF